MKCLIIKNGYDHAGQIDYQCERLKSELELFGINVNILAYSGEFFLTGGNVKTAEVDFCIFLDKDKYAAELLEKSGVRLFNSARAVAVCDDKMLTQIALSGVVNMPDAIPAPLCYRPSTVSEKLLERVQTEFGFPVIIKESYGSMGRQVYKADDKTQLRAIEERLMLKPHFFQRYIETNGSDVRIIVIGGNFFCAYMRSNPNDFRSNIACGADAVPYSPTPEMIAAAEAAARALGLDYCGVDVFPTNPPLICEVNSNAFFTAAEATTHLNVARAYAKHIIAQMTK